MLAEMQANFKNKWYKDNMLAEISSNIKKKQYKEGNGVKRVCQLLYVSDISANTI